MTNYGSKLAHVLGVYLAGLLAIALGITHGQITRASLLACVPAAVTFSVETFRQLTNQSQSLSALVSLGEQVEPLVEKYLPAVKGVLDNPSVAKILLSSTYGKGTAPKLSEMDINSAYPQVMDTKTDPGDGGSLL